MIGCLVPSIPQAKKSHKQTDGLEISKQSLLFLRQWLVGLASGFLWVNVAIRGLNVTRNSQNTEVRYKSVAPCTLPTFSKQERERERKEWREEKRADLVSLKVSCVTSVGDTHWDGRRYLTVVQSIPVHPTEPAMIFDVFRPILRFKCSSGKYRKKSDWYHEHTYFFNSAIATPPPKEQHQCTTPPFSPSTTACAHIDINVRVPPCHGRSALYPPQIAEGVRTLVRYSDKRI